MTILGSKGTISLRAIDVCLGLVTWFIRECSRKGEARDRQRSGSPWGHVVETNPADLENSTKQHQEGEETLPGPGQKVHTPSWWGKCMVRELPLLGKISPVLQPLMEWRAGWHLATLHDVCRCWFACRGLNLCLMSGTLGLWVSGGGQGPVKCVCLSCVPHWLTSKEAP